MAETTPYFEMITADRALRLTDDQALSGRGMLSIETQDECRGFDVLTYIETNFPAFLQRVRYLDAEDQAMILAYYALAKTQTQLALIFHSTQTLMSKAIRRAIAMIASLIALEPTPENLAPVFIRAGVEHTLKTPLSQIVPLYARTRSFQRVAEVFGLHRPSVRRAFVTARVALADSQRLDDRAVNAYLTYLTDKASADGVGDSQRERAKKADCICATTSPVLGQFRIDVSDPAFADHIFRGRADL